jgi:hypothetical protein
LCVPHVLTAVIGLQNEQQPNPVMDATRISDGKTVMLKRIKYLEHPFEIEINQLFSTQPQASDPRNHCVPILEVLKDPEDEDSSILVMPFLRPYYDPKFDTYGEAVECFRQLFEASILRSLPRLSLKPTCYNRD